ncbi:MAG TPA: hypothetical protein VFW25_10940 [Silvibacterium sp.]|nr:hypothetical protein [Silvibacterium sp.]
MALTVEAIRNAESDEVLFDLLSAELQRLLPEGVQDNRDLYHQTLNTLPRGLRAMAGIHFFDVSMSSDSLAWHFGNQNDDRDLQQTLNGLRELDLSEIADMFEQMWEFMKPYMSVLKTGEFEGRDFSDWLVDIGAGDFARGKDEYIWAYCEMHADYGLLSSWLTYARKYPAHCVARVN